MSHPTSYLGDGVYAENDGFGLELRTENGIEITNRIYLEPVVYQNLLDYMRQCVIRTLNNEEANKSKNR
jgi:hypothetical protein